METTEETQSSTAGFNFVIREGKSEHEGFVARSWVDTARGSSRQNRSVDPGIFNAWHYGFVERVLKRAKVRVATPEDNENTIYGFAVLEPGMVHIVYTRKVWRNRGIARGLLSGINADNTAFSTWSQDVGTWALSKLGGAKYVPYWLTESNQNG